MSFDEKPLATASIGQVHRAVLATPDGNVDVVVKVQRPGVGDTVARDLELLHMMAAAIERAIPETKIYSPVGLVNQFDRSITSELNFQIEADNAERFALNFADKSVRPLPEGLPPGVEQARAHARVLRRARRSSRRSPQDSRDPPSPSPPSGSSSR